VTPLGAAGPPCERLIKAPNFHGRSELLSVHFLFSALSSGVFDPRHFFSRFKRNPLRCHRAIA
jgi:hypothetical protein